MRSRSEARRALDEGRVLVPGIPTPGPATLVTPGTGMSLTQKRAFVSRGGNKLDGALEELEVRVEGRSWLDAGASTGGFTDRLLQGNARRVLAVDVGYGQFDWTLRNDERVTLLERTNLRDLEPSDLPFAIDGVVADLSFISLTLVLPVLARLGSHETDHVLLVKPQFEVGKEDLPRGGVVKDPDLWRRAIAGVVETAGGLGLGLVGAVPSRWPGPAGNREFFVHLRRDEDSDMGLIAEAVQEATKIT